MPGPGYGIRQVFGKRQAVKPLAFNSVMGCDNAEQNLPQKQCAHDPEILCRRPHGRGNRDLVENVLFRHAAFGQNVLPPDIKLLGIIGNQRAGCGEQQDNRCNAPHQHFCRRLVADQRFMRPVAGIGNILIRPVGRGPPGGPEVKCRQLFRFHRRQQTVNRKSIITEQRQSFPVITLIKAHIVRLHLCDGLCTQIADRDCTGVRIIGISTHFLLQGRFRQCQVFSLGQTGCSSLR